MHPTTQLHSLNPSRGRQSCEFQASQGHFREQSRCSGTLSHTVPFTLRGPDRIVHLEGAWVILSATPLCFSDLYYGGEAFSVEQPQSFTCPYCGKMGYTETSLQEHVTSEHAETSTEVVGETFC